MSKLTNSKDTATLIFEDMAAKILRLDLDRAVLSLNLIYVLRTIHHVRLQRRSSTVSPTAVI